MRLQNLQLRNFRCFPREQFTSIDLDASVVLFHGRNGYGKTSLFDGIEFGLTGAVERLQLLKPLGRFLVNARSRDRRAEVSLGIVQDGRIETVESSVGVNESHGTKMIDERQAWAFQHAVYLAQANLQRLVQAPPATLGEVVWKSAADPYMDMLVSGLNEARIDRRNCSYQNAVYAIDDSERRLASITADIDVKIRGIEVATPAASMQQTWQQRYVQITEQVGGAPPRSVVDVATLRTSAAQLVNVLQDRLASELRQQQRRKRSLDVLTVLLAEQRSIDSLTVQAHEREQQLTTFGTDLTTLRTELASADEQLHRAAEIGGGVTRTIALLRQAAEVTGGDSCPICDRPFDNLKAHISSKLAGLTEQESRYSSEAQAWRQGRARIQTQIETVSKNRAVAERQLSELRARVDAFQERLTDALREVDEATSLQGAIGTVQQAITKGEGQVEHIKRLSMDAEALYSELTASTIGVEQIRQDVESLRAQAELQRRQIESAKKQQNDVENFLKTVSALRVALEARFQATLDDFVQTRTADTFTELFQRLTRNPYFRVEVESLEVRYHKPTLNWFATCDGEQYEGTGVFSYGDLNACALALFMALAMAQPAPMGLLIMDDPVQNMDEVHIEEFAQVLKSIKDDVGWQLVVGVHDEGVFDYFKRQLYPSRPDQRYSRTSLRELAMGASCIASPTTSIRIAIF